MTHSAPHSENDECYTDYALQEYALGRLTPSVRNAVEGHLGECTACSEALETIRLEVCYFQELSDVSPAERGADCVSDDDLALFRDGNFDESDYNTILEHLQRCGTCRAALIEIRTESARAMAQVEGREAVERSESPTILLMPKRKPLPQGDENNLLRIDIKRMGT